MSNVSPGRKRPEHLDFSQICADVTGRTFAVWKGIRKEPARRAHVVIIVIVIIILGQGRTILGQGSHAAHCAGEQRAGKE